MAGGFSNKTDTGTPLTAAELLWVQTGSAGVLLLTEQGSTPGTTAGVGKVYSKTDGDLYYLDGSGVEHLLNVVTNGFADNETPSGTIDGVNDTFTLANAPSPAASLILVLNGQVLTQGVEYTLSSLTITFTTPPDAAYSGLPFKAWYRY